MTTRRLALIEAGRAAVREFEDEFRVLPDDARQAARRALVEAGSIEAVRATER